MELAIIIYFIDVVCSLPNSGFGLMMCWFCVFTFVAGVFRYICYLGNKEDNQEFFNDTKRLHSICTSIAVVWVIVATLIPTKDTAYKMLAAYGVQQVALSPEARELGSKSLDVLNKAMDDYLKDQQPKENN